MLKNEFKKNQSDWKIKIISRLFPYFYIESDFHFSLSLH